MTPTAIFSLVPLAEFSLVDLRYRVVPGATVFFLAAVLLSARSDPVQAGLVVLAVLLREAGVRRGIVGEADFFILGVITCLFDWPATVLVLVGVEVWRREWRWWCSEAYRPDDVSRLPVLPGIFVMNSDQ